MCELGAGRSGLAGMAIAACGGVESVWLTDGNPTSVAALEVAVKDNGYALRVNSRTGWDKQVCASPTEDVKMHGGLLEACICA